jgi:hypothetical protein
MVMIRRIAAMALMIALIVSPAVAIAGYQHSVLKPSLTYGEYGSSKGRIYEPVYVAADNSDNIYIIHKLYPNLNDTSKSRMLLSKFDRNGSFIYTVDLAKRAGSNDIDIAGRGDLISDNFYYDITASCMDIGDDGKIYILSGYDIVILDNNGKYRSQFTTWPNAEWIHKYKSVTYYSPRGIYVDNMTKIYTTTGTLPTEHAILVYSYDGRLLNKIETPTKEINTIFADSAGTIHLLSMVNNSVTAYDKYLNNIRTVKINLSGKYVADFISMTPDSRFVINYNGTVFEFNNKGDYLKHYVDYDPANNSTKYRPTTVDSTGRIIVVSGIKEKNLTAKPILIYNSTLKPSPTPAGSSGFFVPTVDPRPIVIPSPSYHGEYKVDQQSEGSWVNSYREDYQPIACCVPYAPLYLLMEGVNLLVHSIGL